MSYRVDIPTLSTNEVYTLTFEYEGTETIQLIVGDLTLETTDRRVVFTTTSPVNYIESNMNLTNLNIYEGYYESDDFGGEYTQESYIEGKSLVNYHDFNRCNLTLNNGTQGKWEFLDDGFARMTTLDVNYNHCRPKPTNYTSEATYTVATWVRNFNSEAGNVMFECFHYLDTIKTIKLDGSIITGNDSGIHHYSTGQEGLMISVGKYTGISSKITNGTYHQYMGNFGTSGGFVSGDSVEIFVMVLEGDKADDILNGLIQPFHGIGCVKSPTIKSLSPENLYVSPLKYREPLRGYEYYHNDGTVEIYPNGGGAYSAIDLYTGKDVGLLFTGSQKTWYVNNGIKLGLGAGTYYFCCEIELVANKQITDFTGKPQIDVIYDNAQYFGVISSNFTETYDGEKYYYKGTYGASYKTVADDIRGIYVGIWSYGISGVEKYIIRNITLTREANLKDICAISKSSMITTPDDLELYSLSGVQDALDLTNGLVTRKIGKLTNCHELISAHSYSEDGGYFTARLYWDKIQNININGNQTLLLCNVLRNGSYYKPNTIWSHGMDKAYYLHFGSCTTLEEARQYCLDNNLTILYELKEPITEQLPTPLNALKSYQNGSIQTSSQQLAPTLTTTLPISNKFTTTNLTSGSTYNVYFDGTATKLDAGGTIITNPVSPCEVECGGTTLTIEGINIQNVRVLETTVKNEVGSVCGTTDVELSRIKTKCKLYNYFDDIVISQNIATTTEIDYEVSKMIVTPTSNTVAYNVSQVIALSGTYKFHCKVKMKSLTDKYKFMFGNTNMNTNDVTPTSLVEEINLVTYINTNTQAYFYALYANNPVEYYDISLIKLSDEDITGTDTSSINYSQVISDLEQPIKLRSLGTTYDSYNPVTGELIKRIGVSETDGSYSVLSSPIVENISMGKPTNLISANFPITIDSTKYKDFYFDAQQGTEYTIEFDIGAVGNETECGICRVGTITGVDWMTNGKKSYTLGTNKMVITTDTINPIFFFRIRGENTIVNTLKIVKGNYGNSNIPTYTQVPSHLYTNGQVKVYSDSDVYPTTILNGQSTNNYEINELNKSNNYTIRYDGECESIILNGKSNEQGTNRIVKTSTNGSGNLTFVNNSRDIDNVLLVQNDVREQEINHFNGLQTVEVSQLFVSSKQNLFEAYMKNDFEYTTDLRWGTQQYGSLHNGVFKCGELVGGENLQMTWNLIRPHADAAHSSKLKEDNPIVLANKVYNISFNISIVDHHTVNGGHNYTIKAYDFNGNEVLPQKATGGRAWLNIDSNGVTNPTPTNFINLDVIFSKDIYCFVLHADYGGAWKFDCTITDFTICEPENAKPDVPLVYEYIDLPQPVQLNSLPDGTCDTYNPITGEHVQNVGYFVLDDTFASRWLVSTLNGHHYAQRQVSTQEPNYLTLTRDYGFPSNLYDYQAGTKAIANIPIAYSMLNTGDKYPIPSLFGDTWFGNYHLRIALPFIVTEKDQWNYSYTQVNDWLRENPIHIVYKRTEPITTQLTPITIPTFEGGTLQLITTDGKVFPMIEYSMPTNNRYDTSSWETGVVYTQRNMTEAYFNESTTPMTPTETMTLTTDHISSGSIILNDNGNGLIVLKGNYTGRDIPYFTGMRSVEAIEVETTPSPDQPLFGKGGRK